MKAASQQLLSEGLGKELQGGRALLGILGQFQFINQTIKKNGGVGRGGAGRGGVGWGGGGGAKWGHEGVVGRWAESQARQTPIKPPQAMA